MLSFFCFVARVNKNVYACCTSTLGQIMYKSHNRALQSLFEWRWVGAMPTGACRREIVKSVSGSHEVGQNLNLSAGSKNCKTGVQTKQAKYPTRGRLTQADKIKSYIPMLLVPFSCRQLSSHFIWSHSLWKGTDVQKSIE